MTFLFLMFREDDRNGNLDISCDKRKMPKTQNKQINKVGKIFLIFKRAFFIGPG